MNRLAAMQLCPAFTSRPFTQIATAASMIGVGEHEIRIAPAELEDGLLELRAGLRRDGAAGGDAAGERHRAHERMRDDGGHLRRVDHQGAEEIRREAGAPEEQLRAPSRSPARSARA